VIKNNEKFINVIFSIYEATTRIQLMFIPIGIDLFLLFALVLKEKLIIKKDF